MTCLIVLAVLVALGLAREAGLSVLRCLARPHNAACHRCHGSGIGPDWLRNSWRLCRHCKGTGRHRHPFGPNAHRY